VCVFGVCVCVCLVFMCMFVHGYSRTSEHPHTYTHTYTHIIASPRLRSSSSSVVSEGDSILSTESPQPSTPGSPDSVTTTTTTTTTTTQVQEIDRAAGDRSVDVVCVCTRVSVYSVLLFRVKTSLCCCVFACFVFVCGGMRVDVQTLCVNTQTRSHQPLSPLTRTTHAHTHTHTHTHTHLTHTFTQTRTQRTLNSQH